MIVTALSTNQISENVTAIPHAGDTYFTGYGARLSAWDVKYTHLNDNAKYKWADPVNGKGVIYYLRDEWMNECHYDFKNILFTRTGSAGGIPVPQTDNYFTFSWVDENNTVIDLSLIGNSLLNNEESYSGMFGNKIGRFSSSYPGYYQPIEVLSNNVFISTFDYESGYFYGCFNNTFGNDNNNNTFGNNNNNNTFGNNNNNITFGNENGYNTFGDDNYNNTFGNGNSYNTFGDSNSYITFGDYNYITFGNFNNNNTFGDGNYITFGNFNYNNTFGNENGYNTFGDDNNNNTFGNENYYITFGDSNSYITFGDDNNNNTFGNVNINNTFGNSNYYNTFGNNNYSNTFGDIRLGLNNFNHNINGSEINYSAATHLVANYQCDIFLRADSTPRLRYCNSSDVEVIVAVNS